MVARHLLYSVLALAIVTSLGVGLQRIAWDRAYQTVGLVVPAQELKGSLTEGELDISLTRLRAQGVVALSVELADFSEWNLPRTDLSDKVFEIVRAAQAIGLRVAFVVDADHQEIPSVALRPDYVILRSEHGSLVPSWIMTDLPSALIGVLEFSEPSGLEDLYRWGQRNFVRAHAIKSQELDRLGLEGAVARWERAVQERTIRLLWITEHRRFPQYLERLSQRLIQLGMELGPPSAPAPFESSYWIYLVIGLGFVSLIVLVFMEVSRLSAMALLLGGAVGVIALALVGRWDLDLARQALALMIAVLAPWLLLLMSKERLLGWKLLLLVSLGSSCAGLAAAAVLSELSFFLKLAEFRGVKLALIAPSLLIILTELLRGGNQLTAQLKRGGWLIPALGLGALFVLVLERSGNLPVIPVARWEELLRERLEDWLTARPRFKEFFVGHPALLLWRREQNLVQKSLLALGALGQASIINTFVHLHTPLMLSLWRTLNGLMLGLLLGLFACSVLWGIKRWRRRL